MELGKAIVAVSRFVARGNDAPEVLRRVKFFADAAGHWAHATDGRVGCVVRLDAPVPEMVVDAAAVMPLARYPASSVGADLKDVEFLFREGGRYAFDRPTDEQFPPVPPRAPDAHPVPDWADVAKVFHAALKVGGSVEGVKRPDLECVHFLADRVEATDAHRLVIADVTTPVRGKVPARVFRNWPTGPVSAHCTDTHAWFDACDQYRYATLQPGAYASGTDLRTYVPDDSTGGLAVDAVDLLGAVQKAAKVATAATVMLEFCNYTITIKGASEAGAYERSLVSDLGMPLEQDSVLMDGKMLEAFLRTVDTPRVMIQNFVEDGVRRWIRLAAGAVVASIYGRT